MPKETTSEAPGESTKKFDVTEYVNNYFRNSSLGKKFTEKSLRNAKARKFIPTCSKEVLQKTLMEQSEIVKRKYMGSVQTRNSVSVEEKDKSSNQISIPTPPRSGESSPVSVEERLSSISSDELIQGANSGRFNARSPDSPEEPPPAKQTNNNSNNENTYDVVSEEENDDQSAEGHAAAISAETRPYSEKDIDIVDSCPTSPSVSINLNEEEEMDMEENDNIANVIGNPSAETEIPLEKSHDENESPPSKRLKLSTNVEDDITEFEKDDDQDSTHTEIICRDNNPLVQSSPSIGAGALNNVSEEELSGEPHGSHDENMNGGFLPETSIGRQSDSVEQTVNDSNVEVADSAASECTVPPTPIDVDRATDCLATENEVFDESSSQLKETEPGKGGANLDCLGPITDDRRSNSSEETLVADRGTVPPDREITDIIAAACEMASIQIEETSVDQPLVRIRQDIFGDENDCDSDDEESNAPAAIQITNAGSTLPQNGQNDSQERTANWVNDVRQRSGDNSHLSTVTIQVPAAITVTATTFTGGGIQSVVVNNGVATASSANTENVTLMSTTSTSNELLPLNANNCTATTGGDVGRTGNYAALSSTTAISSLPLNVSSINGTASNAIGSTENMTHMSTRSTSTELLPLAVNNRVATASNTIGNTGNVTHMSTTSTSNELLPLNVNNCTATTGGAVGSTGNYAALSSTTAISSLPLNVSNCEITASNAIGSNENITRMSGLTSSGGLPLNVNNCATIPGPPQQVSSVAAAKSVSETDVLRTVSQVVGSRDPTLKLPWPTATEPTTISGRQIGQINTLGAHMTTRLRQCYFQFGENLRKIEALTSSSISMENLSELATLINETRQLSITLFEAHDSCLISMELICPGTFIKAGMVPPVQVLTDVALSIEQLAEYYQLTIEIAEFIAKCSHPKIKGVSTIILIRVLRLLTYFMLGQEPSQAEIKYSNVCAHLTRSYTNPDLAALTKKCLTLDRVWQALKDNYNSHGNSFKHVALTDHHLGYSHFKTRLEKFKQMQVRASAMAANVTNQTMPQQQISTTAYQGQFSHQQGLSNPTTNIHGNPTRNQPSSAIPRNVSSQIPHAPNYQYAPSQQGYQQNLQQPQRMPFSGRGGVVPPTATSVLSNQVMTAGQQRPRLQPQNQSQSSAQVTVPNVTSDVTYLGTYMTRQPSGYASTATATISANNPTSVVTYQNPGSSAQSQYQHIPNRTITLHGNTCNAQVNNVPRQTEFSTPGPRMPSGAQAPKQVYYGGSVRTLDNLGQFPQPAIPASGIMNNTGRNVSQHSTNVISPNGNTSNAQVNNVPQQAEFSVHGPRMTSQLQAPNQLHYGGSVRTLNNLGQFPQPAIPASGIMNNTARNVTQISANVIQPNAKPKGRRRKSAETGHTQLHKTIPWTGAPNAHQNLPNNTPVTVPHTMGQLQMQARPQHHLQPHVRANRSTSAENIGLIAQSGAHIQSGPRCSIASTTSLQQQLSSRPVDNSGSFALGLRELLGQSSRALPHHQAIGEQNTMTFHQHDIQAELENMLDQDFADSLTPEELNMFAQEHANRIFLPDANGDLIEYNASDLSTRRHSFDSYQ